MLIHLSITIILIGNQYVNSINNLNCAIQLLRSHSESFEHIFVNFSQIFEIYPFAFQTFTNTSVLNVNFEETSLKKVLIETKADLLSNYRVRPRFYLIVITENFFAQMGHYKKDVSWNPRAKFIFLSSSNMDYVQFNKYLKAAYISRFVLIQDGEIYGWNLNDLSDIYLSKEENLLSSYGLCSGVMLNMNIFASKNCSSYDFLDIRYSYYEYPPFTYIKDSEPTGIEINILKMFSEVIPFHFTFVNRTDPVQWGPLINNRVVRGEIALLRNEEVQIYFGKTFWANISVCQTYG